MATVNVYTYYTHKLAHEKMPRTTAARQARRLPRLHPLWLAVLVLVLWVQLVPPAQPVAALTGAGLALAVVYGLNRFTIRTQKVWRALNGMSLGADDLEVLRGR
ncbi:MAG: hypothetical protein U0931_31620 [Vulcanimicrobiota bacterium]